METSRWVVAVVVFLCAISLVIWARGADHHRGDDVGSLSAQVVAEPGSTL